LNIIPEYFDEFVPFLYNLKAAGIVKSD